MKLTFVTAATLLAAALAAVVKDPSTVGPLSPEKDPRTSLEESIRRMRLSIDRELVYLARMNEMKRSMNTDGMVARQELPADKETASTFHGFTDKVNDGTDLFRPIRPGVEVPSARQFDDLEPSDGPVPPTDDPVPPTDDPVPPTDDPVPPTDGPIPPTDGPILPTDGPILPTDGPILPTEDPGNGPGISEPPIETPGVTPTDDPMPSDPVETPIVGETPIPTDDTTDPSLAPETAAPEDTEIPEPTLPIPAFIGEGGSTPEPSMEPSPEPSEPAIIDDDDVCFPAHATVQLDDGRVKKMSEVQLGDRVLVAGGEYSEVFMFTHKMSSVRHSFIEILTASGHRLALTKGHYLYVNDKLAAASTVRKGDMLTLGNNAKTTVQDVTSIVSTGLYNPQTVHGDIIVNGVRASTYTLSVEPKMAHALLAPLRAVYDRIGFSLSAFDMGADYLASLVPSGSLVN